MTIPFRYVRRKDSPLTIKMSGFCDFTGQFDPATYEMVEAKLPASVEQELPMTLTQTLIGALKQSNLTTRTAFYGYFAPVETALRADDLVAARQILQNLSALPAAVETLRQTILARLS